RRGRCGILLGSADDRKISGAYRRSCSECCRMGGVLHNGRTPERRAAKQIGRKIKRRTKLEKILCPPLCVYLCECKEDLRIKQPRFSVHSFSILLPVLSAV